MERESAGTNVSIVDRGRQRRGVCHSCLAIGVLQIMAASTTGFKSMVAACDRLTGALALLALMMSVGAQQGNARGEGRCGGEYS